MILGGLEIKNRREQGDIVIEPFDEKNIGPNSYDVHLGEKLMRYDTRPGGWLDPENLPQLVEVKKVSISVLRRSAAWQRSYKNADPIFMDAAIQQGLAEAPPSPVRSVVPEKDDECWLLIPGSLYLASTMEYTETNGLVPMIEGRSSIGRLGIFIHATAGFGDVGFKGNWTLEISVVEPVVLRPHTRIAQLFYHTICGGYVPYNGRYLGDRGATGSRFAVHHNYKEQKTP